MPPGMLLDPLGDDAWRLCDDDLDSDDANRLVAYVERMSDAHIEAVWLRFGESTTTHSSPDDVVRHATALRELEAPSTSAKPAPIPHLPPVNSDGPSSEDEGSDVRSTPRNGPGNARSHLARP
ncbi:hypothetical protein GCM10009775_22260 [Microbacterium aoyamense]|uniref:Uncharacterized protein n=1 Tax=Microbacterium aoyamense TaxID=344166 RepID=A0ABN2PSU5_9MICO